MSKFRAFLACTILFLGLVPASAQIAPPRTLEELKTETQARADRNAYPLIGLRPDDVREALSRINSLDRDEWAAAWSAVAERYDIRARSEEASGNGKAAQADYLMAWRYYSFGRWPVFPSGSQSINILGKIINSNLFIEVRFSSENGILNWPTEMLK